MLTCAIYECGHPVAMKSDYCDKHQDSYLRGQLANLQSDLAAMTRRAEAAEAIVELVRDEAESDRDWARIWRAIEAYDAAR